MQFALSSEQELVAATARGFFADRLPNLRATIASEDGYDRSAWRALTTGLGFGGIALPDTLGGAGLGQIELALVMMEMGRTLFPSPFLSSIATAIPAILEVADAGQAVRLLPAIASGATIAALAMPGRSGAVRLSATPDGYEMTGPAGLVPFGHVADRLLVVARGPGDGTSLVAVAADAAGVRNSRRLSMDQTRPLSAIDFDGVRICAADVLGPHGLAAAGLARALDRARIALAAESIGAAEAVLERTVEYTGQRVQFGRPIGSFQAVKHRLADMMVEVEAGKTAVYYAAATADEDPAGLAEAAAIAAFTAADAFATCAGEAIQLHGGIGFTWEHDAQLFFKRARSAATLLGTPAEARESLARIIGLDAVPA